MKQTAVPDVRFTIGEDRMLTLTIPTDLLCVCPHCPDLHISVLNDATPEKLRIFGNAIISWANNLEGRDDDR